LLKEELAGKIGSMYFLANVAIDTAKQKLQDPIA
jgi:hypothetical protein